MSRILLAVIMSGWLVSVSQGAVSISINNATGQIVNTNRPITLTNNVVFKGPVTVSNTLTVNSNMAFTGTGHAGIRLNNLTDAEWDGVPDADGQFIFNTSANRPMVDTIGGRQSVAFLSDVSGVVSNGNLTISTNDFVMNTRYTNGAAYAWVQQFFTLTRAISGTAQVGLYLDQNNDGTFEQTAMGEMAGAGLTSSDTEGLSAFLNTNAVYVFTNLTTGSSTAAIVSGSGQKVTGFGGVGPTTVGTGGGETNLLTLNSNLLFTYYALTASSQTTNFIVDFNISRKTNNATSAIHFQQSTNRADGLWKSQMVQIWTGETNRGLSVNSAWRKVDGSGPMTLLPSNTLVFVNLTSTTADESGVRYWLSMEGTNMLSDADILARIGVTNSIASVYSAGTTYALTTTSALADFGTTDPSIALPVAGTYLIIAEVLFLSGAGGNDVFQASIYNSTDATAIGLPSTHTIPSTAYRSATLHAYVTVAASKTIQVNAKNITAARGSIDSASIAYIRLY